MADISKITLPSGTTYDIKDQGARDLIAAITGGDTVVLIGVSSTAITDGGSQTPTIEGWSGPVRVGDICFYQSQEFIYGPDNKWHALGDLSTLGSLAQKNSVTASYQPAGTVSKPTFTGTSTAASISVTADASGNYTPAGTVSQPTFTGATMTSTGSYQPAGTVTVTTNTTSNKTATVSTATGTATYTPAGTVAAPTISLKTAGTTTNTLKPVTAKSMVSGLTTAAPGATAPANAITYYNVVDETLSLYQIGATKADSVTLGSAVTVKTGDAAYEASTAAFTGTGVRLVTGNIAVPNTFTGSFTGTTATLSVTGTTTGTVSQPTFSGTKVKISGTVTATGNVSQPTFTGTTATITSS